MEDQIQLNVRFYLHRLSLGIQLLEPQHLNHQFAFENYLFLVVKLHFITSFSVGQFYSSLQLLQ
jgi:hypothetical protein